MENPTAITSLHVSGHFLPDHLQEMSDPALSEATLPPNFASLGLS